MMTKISYSGYRFPPEIIQQTIWLYVRFTLSFRDVEDLLAERGVIVSYSYCVISSYGASLCRQAWRSMGIVKGC
jgi:transposase-like protein